MTEAIVKKWGNSLGVIIPKDFVDEKNLKEGDTVNLEKFATLDFNELPKVKTGMPGQEFKDLARKGWD